MYDVLVFVTLTITTIKELLSLNMKQGLERTEYIFRHCKEFDFSHNMLESSNESI